ncbi:MAG: purine-nucleoside phosphorylase [Kiritimatiellae bacterium]|nr:purine-nucleoside phosphorylase [Kiritimatiellia bacterium]
MNWEIFNEAANSLPKVFWENPVDCGLILGSGWGSVLTCDEVLASVAYDRIPGLGQTSVIGHAGELRLYLRHGLRIAAFMGRRHYYEGAGMEPVVMPVELLRRMNGHRLLVTNASGGINPKFKAGDLMVITDHLNTVGINPLIGPVNPNWGVRFPDLSHVYDPTLSNELHAAAAEIGVSLWDGVYAFTAGPVFETPAEVRAYAGMGADAVGMSTVPECTLACAIGIPTAGLSCIANPAAGIKSEALNHQEVLDATQKATPRMAILIDAFLARFAPAR